MRRSLLRAAAVLTYGHANVAAVTGLLLCTAANSAVAHSAPVVLGLDGFAAVVTAAIVRHRPAIKGERVGSRQWAYGAVSVDMCAL